MLDSHRYFTAVLYVFLFVISGLSNVIFKYSTGELSDFYPTLITPSGYAFSVWGFIYLFFAIYSIYQIVPRTSDNPNINNLGVWPALLALSLSLWIVVWSGQDRDKLGASLFIILYGLFCTFVIQNQLGRPVLKDYFLVRFGFSLCLGWLTVASLINLFAFAAAFPREGLDIVVIKNWSFAAIFLILPITIAIMFFWRDPAPSITIAWGLVGIYVKQKDSNSDIAISALVVAVLVALLGISTLSYWIKNAKKYEDVPDLYV